jgi:hypothetical protein
MTVPAPRRTLRRIASALVPPWGKHIIDTFRARRFLAVIAPGNHEYVRRYGLRVARGPFTGMQYLPGLEDTSGDLIGKLSGLYEAELHPALEQWCKEDLSLVVDVGCAEGYYAVGLAYAMPNVNVRAYDVDPVARGRCADLAKRNGVVDRIKVEGECTPRTLGAMPEAGVALLCDCEGCEKNLLDPEIAPTLRGWSIIVELHDAIDSTITETIRDRFVSSHEIELIAYDTGQRQLPSELDFLSPRQRVAVLSERPPSMSWAIMRPRRSEPSREQGHQDGHSAATA